MTFFSSYLFLTTSVSFHFLRFYFVLFCFLFFYFYFIFFLQEPSLTGLMRENCIMMKSKESSVGKAMRKLRAMRKMEHSSWGREHWNFYSIFFFADALFRFIFCNIIDFQRLFYQYFLSHDDGFSFLWRKWRWDNAWLKIILQWYII